MERSGHFQNQMQSLTRLERLGSIGSLSLGCWSLWKVSADGQRFEEGWADSGRSGRFGTLGKLWSGCRTLENHRQVFKCLDRFGLVRFGEIWKVRDLGQASEGMSSLWRGSVRMLQVWRWLERFCASGEIRPSRRMAAANRRDAVIHGKRTGNVRGTFGERTGNVRGTS